MAKDVNDATLLERFVTRREQAAFATLVQRHGPLVLSACRRVLRNEHDAEDVFQATFLVLALKAADVPWRDSIGGWLCAVARRLSLHSRAGVSRRVRRETLVATFAGCGPDALSEDEHPQVDPFAEITRRELRRVLDTELSRLPEKYRAPVVLCDLEGMTHAEAARQLGWPTGSMSRRLERARSLLRDRLAGRGLPLVIVLVCVTVVALRVGRPDRGEGRGPASVRSSSGAVERSGAIGLDLERLLARAGGSAGPGLTRAEVLMAARETASLGERLADLDPGRDREAWRGYAEDLSRATERMTRAAVDDDAPALLAAARQVNATCVSCHVAFRQ
jgi:RNA polymerase sigma-70 factor (ECF subfamily)